MSSAIPAEHYRRIPLAEVASAEKPGPLWSHKDHWWAVDENDCVLVYVGPRGRFNSPVCNTDQRIVARVAPAGTKQQFLPWAWTRFDLNEYRDPS